MRYVLQYLKNENLYINQNLKLKSLIVKCLKGQYSDVCIKYISYCIGKSGETWIEI